MADFWIKEGDTTPAIRRTLQDEDGNAINLTGGATVQFKMRSPGATTPKVDAAATLVDAANGVVEYAWATGDTDTAGSYWAEFEVTFPSGKIETFPNYKHLLIRIVEEVG
ncbi:MAG: BppU family phage baseplate upper protein [Candidatus Tectimicrobiota bacterium]